MYSHLGRVAAEERGVVGPGGGAHVCESKLRAGAVQDAPSRTIWKKAIRKRKKKKKIPRVLLAPMLDMLPMY